MIAGAELCDIRANLGDDPGDLVAEYCWKRRDIVRSEQLIGVTQPRGAHIDENFAPDRRSDVDVIEIEATAERVDDQRLHGVSLQSGSKLAVFPDRFGLLCLSRPFKSEELV
jgi:hypothetical protein